MAEYTHKGYTLSQADYNNHYVIFGSNGDLRMHVPYKYPITTQEKAVELIEHYIRIAEKLDSCIDELMNDDEDSEI